MPYIDREGSRIHYEEAGSGPTLVCLHDLLFDSRMWASQVDLLARELRVITVDFRGHGLSSVAKRKFTLYDLVADVVGVLDACEVDRAVWMGHSLGAMVALRAAVVAPEVVESLILLDGDAGTESSATRFRYRTLAIAARMFGIGAVLSVLSGQLFGRTTRRHTPDLIRMWEGRFRAVSVPSMLFGLEALLRRDSIRPLLHEIDVPALVMAGEEDDLFPPAHSREMAEGIIGARFEIVREAGHLAPLEKPDLVNAIITEFLRSSRTPAEESSVATQDSVALSVESFGAGPESTFEPLPPPPAANEWDEEGAEWAPPEARVEASHEDPVAPEPARIESVEDPVAPEPARIESVEEPSPAEIANVEKMLERENVEPEGRKLPSRKTASERRRKRRVAPSRKLYGRIGHVGVLLVDLSESGARIEHYNRRFEPRSTITMEMEWEGQTFRIACRVMSCRVHRFIPGEKGATVYQSGLQFEQIDEGSNEVLKELVGRLVTRGLAEQVANARGIGPVLQRDMPTFRSGVVNAAGRPREAGSEGPARLIREHPLTDQIGFIRCRKIKGRWETKWTLDPAQPKEGFTVLATENKLDIEMLCDTWDRGSEDARKFIQDCARASIGIEKTEADAPRK